MKAISNARPSLQALFGVFARHGNLTFGGGNATPGTNLLAFSTAVGWMLRGLRGAAVTLLAGSLPCALLAVMATAFYELWSRNHTAQIALRGALVAAVAVMVLTGVTIIRPHWRGASALKLLAFAGGAFAASVFLAVPPIRILLAAAMIGGLWPAAGKSE